MVPPSKRAAKLAEAAKLPKALLTDIDVNWLQVRGRRSMRWSRGRRSMFWSRGRVDALVEESTVDALVERVGSIEGLQLTCWLGLAGSFDWLVWLVDPSKR